VPGVSYRDAARPRWTPGISARERDAAAAERWFADAVRHDGNIDIARHDCALRDLRGDRLRCIIGD
jgi:hypothetical protein